MKKVSAKMITIKYIRNILILIIVAIVGALILAGMKTDVSEVIFNVILWSVGVFYLLLAIVLMIYPPLAYKNYRYEYNGDKITAKFGVIFKHTIVVPVIQLQDIHTYQGPLMQLFNLTSVIVSTAGSNFFIKYLLFEEAKQMVDDLEVAINSKHSESEADACEKVL